MSLSKQEFTNAGRDMLGAAQAGDTLNITKIVVGSGSAAVPSDLWPLTNLIAFEMNVTISSKRYLGNGVMIVEGNFRSDEAPHAFYLRELGIMANVAALVPADRLYSVANVFADPPDYIDPAAPTIQSFKIKLIVDRVDPDNITVTIGPSEAIMGENVGDETTGPGWFKEADGNILKFKRAVAGPGIELTEAPAPADGADTIEIATKQLRTNVDLYVPASYPGAPPDAVFATVQAAHDYLLAFHIPADKLAKIHVYSGHFANTIPTVFAHPDAARIQVLGLDIIARSITGAITRTGALPTVDVTVNVTPTTGIAVNDVVYLYDMPGATGASFAEGCGYVVSFTTHTVTVRMHIENISPPASVNALASTKLLIFPTQFTSNFSGAAVFKCPNGINLIKNFAFKSTIAQQGTAVDVLGLNAALQHVLAVNYEIGIGIGASITNFTPIVAANACSIGIEVGPSGSVFLQPPDGIYDRFTWNGNLVYGLWVVGGTYVTGVSGSKTYACCNSTGIRSDTRAFVGCSNSGSPNGGWIIAYNDEGIHAAMLAIALASNDVECAIALNTTDLIATQGAQISIVHNSTMSGTYLPPLDTLGPDGGYVHIGTLNPIGGFGPST